MAYDFRLTGPIGSRAVLGLIVLQSDETLEPDMQRIFAAQDIAVYVSRVPSGIEVTPDTLAAMEAELPRAAGLFPPSLQFDTIAYGCTSGATVIGPERVARAVRSAADVAQVTNPLSAVIAGLTALGTPRIGLLSPYIASVTTPMEAAFAVQDITVAQSVTFDESEDAKVARIDPESIYEAALEAGRGDVQAVFLSCTNLRTLDIIPRLEDTLGKPVVSSNQALAWHMARLSGIDEALGPGRLWDLAL
jgi:maleate isomerase